MVRSQQTHGATTTASRGRTQWFTYDSQMFGNTWGMSKTMGFFAVINWGSYSNPGYLLYIRGIILPRLCRPCNGWLEGSLRTNQSVEWNVNMRLVAVAHLTIPPTPQTFRIQSPYCQMIIGVYNHLQNERYLASMKPFSVSVFARIPRDWNPMNMDDLMIPWI